MTALGQLLQLLGCLHVIQRAFARLHNSIANRVADAVRVCQYRSERDAPKEPEQQIRDRVMHRVEFPIRGIAALMCTARHCALRGAVSHVGEFRKRHMVTSLFVGHFDERSKTEFLGLVIMVHGDQDRSISFRSERLKEGQVEVHMQNRATVAGVLVLVFAGIVGTLSVSSRPSYVHIAGHVYDATGRATLTPVAGAVVSTDWDSTTSTTDAQGEFRMRVRRVAEDEWIKFSARSGETAGRHRQVGPLESRTVDIVLGEPMQRWRCM